MLTVVILSSNSEKKITQALSSIDFAGEVIIVDDNSVDKTRLRVMEFKQRYPKIKVKFIKKNLVGDFAGQRNYADRFASGDWIMHLDSDEVVTGSLSSQIRDVLKTNGRTEAYRIKRSDIYMGRKLQWGEAGGQYIVRLYKKGSGKWKGKVHERFIIRGRIRRLMGEILHYSHRDTRDFLNKVNFYSSLEAESRLKGGKKMLFIQTFLYPAFKFIYNYFFRLGFLDGLPGFSYAFMMSFHSFLVRAKFFNNETESKFI